MADRVFLALESELTPQHVAFLATFALPAGTDSAHYMRRLFRLLNTAPVVAPFTFLRGQARLGIFGGTWNVLPPEDIDLSHHLRRSALPAPGSDRELLDLVSQLHSRQLDSAHPLWECHVIEGLADERFALYFKVHHALIDGMGIEQRFRQMLSEDPEDEAVRPPWSIAEHTNNVAAVDSTTLAGQLLGRVRGFAVTAVGAGQVARNVVRAVRTLDNPARAVPFVIPRSPLNGAVGQQRRVVTRSYGFDRLRTVAKAADVTINEVLLSACGGALRRCLAAAGALPARSLTAGTPVSTRESGDATTANAFGMTVMSLGTDVADPLERLRTVARSSAIAKQELKELPKGATGLYGALFTWPFVAQNVLGAGGGTRPPYNVVVSNIPGSSKQQYFTGSRLEAIYPVGSVSHGVGLFIAARSSSERFDVCLLGDRASLVPLEELGDHLSDEILCLERAVGVSAPPFDLAELPVGGQKREECS
ncbi:wax ester/triacylglycerol synthase family O-acyltransferase [Streptomyces sp. NPDC048282]|uniref:wax ester/triacylglycerol synthase family O-acyltransferase n=1 Tax=Streptomyces sp. NPDC048282 TaxID=3365528 RepID=UPI003723DA61